MCAALDRILAGGWDFAAAERTNRQRNEASRRYEEVVSPTLDGTIKDGRPTAETFARLDKAIAGDPELELGQLSQWKFVFLLNARRFEDAIKYGEKLVDSVYADRPTKLRMIASFLTEDNLKQPGANPAIPSPLKPPYAPANCATTWSPFRWMFSRGRIPRQAKPTRRSRPS